MGAGSSIEATGLAAVAADSCATDGIGGGFGSGSAGGVSLTSVGRASGTGGVRLVLVAGVPGTSSLGSERVLSMTSVSPETSCRVISLRNESSRSTGASADSGTRFTGAAVASSAVLTAVVPLLARRVCSSRIVWGRSCGFLARQAAMISSQAAGTAGTPVMPSSSRRFQMGGGILECTCCQSTTPNRGGLLLKSSYNVAPAE